MPRRPDPVDLFGAGGELHPCTGTFEWQKTRVPLRALSRDQAVQFDEDGYLVLQGLFEAGLVRRLVCEIDPIEAEVDAFLRSREEQRLSRSKAGVISYSAQLVEVSHLLRRFCAGPVVQDLCLDLIGDDVRLYADVAVYKKPGQQGWCPWHQDNGAAFVDPQQYVTFWLALTDATVDSGCLWVLPGSHRHGTLWHRSTPDGWQCLDSKVDAVPVQVSAGSLVVLSSLVVHASGPNQSGSTRKAYMTQYVPAHAQVLESVGPAGRVARTPCDAPRRQFQVLRAGQPRYPDYPSSPAPPLSEPFAGGSGS